MTTGLEPAAEARLREIVIEESGLPDDTVISAEMRLEEDLDLDSLARLSLGSALEQEFGIEMTDESFDGMRTFGDVCDLVRGRVARG
jgi:acyl carrier protein